MYCKMSPETECTCLLQRHEITFESVKTVRPHGVLWHPKVIADVKILYIVLRTDVSH